MYIIWVMLVLILVYIVRVLLGPSVWDRLLGMNLVATKTIIIIIAYASLQNTPYMLDFAIVYTLIGFIGTVFVAHFLLERTRGGEE